MNRMSTCGCLFSIFVIVGCSSSSNDDGSVITGVARDLQGTFAGPCEFDADGDPTRDEYTFTGSNITLTSIAFVDSTTCDGVTSISTNLFGTFSIDGSRTPLIDGSASNIDMIFSGGSITGSPALLALLESQGTTLTALVAAQGLAGDLNNLSLAELRVDQAESFDIFRLDTTADGTDRLTTGDTDGSFNGEIPALRPINLNPDPNAAFLRIL